MEENNPTIPVFYQTGDLYVNANSEPHFVVLKATYCSDRSDGLMSVDIKYYGDGSEETFLSFDLTAIVERMQLSKVITNTDAITENGYRINIETGKMFTHNNGIVKFEIGEKTICFDDSFGYKPGYLVTRHYQDGSETLSFSEYALRRYLVLNFQLPELLAVGENGDKEDATTEVKTDE